MVSLEDQGRKEPSFCWRADPIQKLKSHTFPWIDPCMSWSRPIELFIVKNIELDLGTGRGEGKIMNKLGHLDDFTAISNDNVL